MTSTSRVLRALAPRQLATLTLFLLTAFMLPVSQALAHNVTAGDAGYRAGRTKLTIPILPTPDRQQRSANAMPPRRGCHLPVADKTFLDDPELVLIRPLPTANAIGCGENFDLRAVNEIGHKAGLIIGS